MEKTICSFRQICYRERTNHSQSVPDERKTEDEADGTQETILYNSFVSLVVYVMLIGVDYQRCLREEECRTTG